jgi:hypothetical protein
MPHRRKNLFDEWDEQLDVGILTMIAAFFDFLTLFKHSISSAWQGGRHEKMAVGYRVCNNHACASCAAAGIARTSKKPDDETG